jgi:L-methionine (R)-S-oxide reductase
MLRMKTVGYSADRDGVSGMIVPREVYGTMNPHLSAKSKQYAEARGCLESLITGVTDEIAVMATVVCELHHRMSHFDWTGFYRVTSAGLLTVGPYQGTHGCLVIPFERGVCGRCARERTTQLVPDVRQCPHHIACSASTRSEIVVPVFDAQGGLRAVLDIDSDEPGAFDEEDVRDLELICGWLAPCYPP